MKIEYKEEERQDTRKGGTLGNKNEKHRLEKRMKMIRHKKNKKKDWTKNLRGKIGRKKIRKRLDITI